MRRRTATLLACGPLVAGCVTATRLHFAGHSRPAPPVNVSVYAGRRTVQVSPDAMRPGLVLFNIANVSGRWERFSVLRGNGRRLAQTPPIPNGGTAQLKAALRGSRYVFGVFGRGPASARFTYVRLNVSGPPRSGNNELMQP